MLKGMIEFTKAWSPILCGFLLFIWLIKYHDAIPVANRETLLRLEKTVQEISRTQAEREAVFKDIQKNALHSSTVLDSRTPVFNAIEKALKAEPPK